MLKFKNVDIIESSAAKTPAFRHGDTAAFFIFQTFLTLVPNIQV